MAYSHCTGTGLGQVHGTGPGLMGPIVLCKNVNTGLRQGKEARPTVSYCAAPAP